MSALLTLATRKAYIFHRHVAQLCLHQRRSFWPHWLIQQLAGSVGHTAHYSNIAADGESTNMHTSRDSVRLSPSSHEVAPRTDGSTEDDPTANDINSRDGNDAAGERKLNNKPVVADVLVTDGCHGWRLDSFMKFHYPFLAFSTVQMYLNTGKLRYVTGGDGKLRHAKISTRLVAGDIVKVPVELTSPSNRHKKRDAKAQKLSEEIQGCILYKDNRIIVLNKPPGLAVQGGSKVDVSLDDVLEALRFDMASDPKRVHRIDKDTSGILILARDAATAKDLHKLFEKDAIQKTYLAITVGAPSPAHGRIAVPIQISTGGVVARNDLAKLPRAEYRSKAGRNIMSAITEYRTIDKYGQYAAFVECHPTLGGRKHQIRVHLAGCVNTPILGDPKYGKNKGPDPAIRGILGDAIGPNAPMHLHARMVVIPKWDRGRDLVVKAPLPPHMAAVMDTLHLKDQ